MRAAMEHAPGLLVADLRIARGLDYYTGTVYETQLVGQESYGSICSGGRYDALASDGRTTYPGVGISIGVSRLLGRLVGPQGLSSSRPTPTCVLVSLAAEEDRAEGMRVAAALRQRGIPVEVAPAAAKFGKQIRFAERRGIPFVWFPGAGESGDQVKDIRSGEQVDADPATWTPPAADLRPRVVAPDGARRGGRRSRRRVRPTVGDPAGGHAGRGWPVAGAGRSRAAPAAPAPAPRRGPATASHRPGRR